MNHKKNIYFTLFMVCLTTSLSAQLIGKTKDKKYLIASFKSLATEEKETIGTIYEARMYFRIDSTVNQLKLIIEHSSNPEFIVANLDHIDLVDLYENQGDQSKLNYITFSTFNVDFIKSPWDNIGLKKGILQFTNIHENPRRFLSYLLLNLPEQRTLRISGYVEDEYYKMQQEMQENKSKKKK